MQSVLWTPPTILIACHSAYDRIAYPDWEGNIILMRLCFILSVAARSRPRESWAQTLPALRLGEANR